MTEPAPQRLTLAQQALVNVLAVVALHVHADQMRVDRMEALAQLLPEARRKAPPQMLHILDAAEEMLVAWPHVRTGKGTPGRSWASVMLDVQAALVTFFDARAFAAWHAHKEAQTAGGADAAA